MAVEFVQNSQIIVQETIINNSGQFWSTKKQFSFFNDYWFSFHCKKEVDDILIYLYMDCPKPVSVTWICTVNSIAKQEISKSENNSVWGFRLGKKTELFVNGIMKIDSTLKINFTTEMVKHMKSRIPYTVTLLDDERFKDFSFCVQNEEIRVHKSVIAVASPVFDAMLEPHCKEFQDGKVVIQDFDYKTVKAAVNLIYTRRLDNGLSMTTLLNLYRFADKYDLVDMDEVSDKLDAKLDLTTLEEVLAFSKVNSMDKLYEKSVRFFRIDYEKNCEEYENFDNLDSDFVKDVVKKRYRFNKTVNQN